MLPRHGTLGCEIGIRRPASTCWVFADKSDGLKSSVFHSRLQRRQCLFFHRHSISERSALKAAGTDDRFRELAVDEMRGVAHSLFRISRLDLAANSYSSS